MEKEPISTSTNDQYLIPISKVDKQDLQAYQVLLKSVSGRNPKDQLRTYKRIIQQPDNPNKHLIKKYMTLPILAEFVFGSSATRHQVLDLLKNVGIIGPDVDHLLNKLNLIEHYRNISELLESLPNKNTNEFRNLFFQPLKKIYLEATQKIESQNFSCKWLQTFLEIVRSINNCLRFYPVNENDKTQILLLTKRTLKHYLILRRDILTHLYIIVLALSPNEPQPQSVLEQIHYFHAKAVLYDQPILQKLLKFITITQTQVKYHLLYVFQYALQKQIETYPNKQQLFAAVVDLYEIGRSAYSMVEGMVKVVIKAGAKWKLDNYLSRNFFLVKVFLKCPDFPLKQIFEVWPDVIRTALQYAGNLSTPFAIDCIQEILTSSHVQYKDNLQGWIDTWYSPYLQFLLKGQKLTIRGIIEQINPVIVKILKKPLLLERLLNLEQVSDNKELGIISLLQCHKELGMISAVNQQRCYIFKDYPSLKVSYKKLNDLLVSNEPNISCKALQFIAISLKLSQPIVPFEYDLIFQYIKYSLGTNSSEYRHRYLQIFKKLFQRLRGIYEKQLNPPPKKTKPVIYYKQFSQFVVKTIKHCAESLYPEIPFEVTCPTLQIWLLLLNYFGVYQHQIKKTNVIQGCNMLKDKGVFTQSYFTSVALLLQSSFENIRGFALNILYQFPQDFKLDADKLWNQCIGITNKLVIRQFQSGCRLLAYIYERHSDKLTGIEKKYELHELDLYYYLLTLLKSRFQVFKEQFTVQSPRFYHNLIHGIATTLSYLFEKLSQRLKKQFKLKKYQKDLRKFLIQLFKTMVQILNFAVDISGTNVSTVVLDSSQSVNKISNQMKIDCRGHFYQDQKSTTLKNLDKMLSGSSLMTSMDDQQNSNIENTLVVSFYLVSKQLGLLFNSIVSLVEIDKTESIIPEENLIDLVNSFFYALVNLKHMGSIDRISKGLQRMSKVLYKKDSIGLISIPENLLKRLLQLLGDSKFTNILRRSAGVPYAFTCLLKSDALRKRQLINLTMSTLFSFSSNQNIQQKQIRIHAFNILKKLFQDSDIKAELDPFVSEGFVRSIKGFGTEDWGVRNSSLMLFSALSLRTLGPKPRLNLMQFFKRCPSLIEFFEVELKSYIQQKVMYPPIYPIALLLSRMVPIDQVRSPENVDSQQQKPKQIHRSDFNKFIPLLQEAGNTPNCMGRIIIAKALFPFMEMKDVLPFCLKTLEQITVQSIKSGHNRSHSRLMNIYQLLDSYYNLQQSKKQAKQIKIMQQEISLITLLSSRINIINEIKCAFVQQIFCRIIKKLLEKRGKLLQKQPNFQDFTQKFTSSCENYLQKHPALVRFSKDLGDSTFRITLLDTFLKFSEFFYPKNQFIVFQTFFTNILKESSKNNHYMKQIDYEVVSTFVNALLTIQQSNPQLQIPQTIKQALLSLSLNPQFQTSQLPYIYRLLSLCNTILSKEQRQYLIALESGSLDPELKVSIFQLLKEHVNLNMLLRFTDPEQLTALRGSVAESIQSYNPSYDIIYIRLLEDEDHQIRKETSHRLSIATNSFDYTQTKIKEIILSKTGQKLEIIRDGDTQTKIKNFKQQRIFSYDKANRYRCDVYNIIDLGKRISVEQSKQFQAFESQLQVCISEYGRSIFSRNQYQFEVILKGLLYKLINKRQTKEYLLEKVEEIDPILTKLIRQF